MGAAAPIDDPAELKRHIEIRIARVYDDPAESDGARLLVDRLWPRGIAKADLRYDHWVREVAPSAELRNWFGHDPARWNGFRNRYIKELGSNPEAVGRCLDWCERGPVTLLYSAKDREHNQAVVLKDYLRQRLTQGARTD